MEEILNYAVTTFVAVSPLIGKAVLEEFTKDAYGRLRDFLTKKAPPADVKALEENLDDDLRQKLLVRELGKTVDDADAKKLFELAEALSQALKEHHAETYHNFNLDLKRAKVKRSVNIKDSEFEGGANIDASDSEIDGDFNFIGNKVKKS